MDVTTQPTDPQTYRRATQAALAGLVVQALLAATLTFLGLWAQSPAIQAAAWHLFGGLPIWLILLLLHNQHRLERVEALEAEQMARSDARAAAIFDQHGDALAVARKRLDRFHRFGLPTVAVVVGAYLLAVGLILLTRNYQALSDGTLTANAVSSAVSRIALSFGLAFAAFIAFLVGRYESGMTLVPQWQLLRGGAGFLMGSALLTLLLAVGAGIATAFGSTATLAAMAVVIPAITTVLGAEVLLNFLLGLYRPRRAGEVPRAAFDSRLLGLLTSPQSLARALSDTINYQFGFEVSRSWFYQLVARAITPLVVFAALVLWLVTAVIVVHPQQQAIVTTFGAITGEPVGPGIHLKWPWPVGRAVNYEVARLRQFSVGSALGGVKKDTALLWTNPHTEGGEEQYLVTAPTPNSATFASAAAPAAGAGAAATAAPGRALPGVSLVGGQMIVQYRIDDLLAFATNTRDPEGRLRALAERELNRYAVTHDIDQIIGAGRVSAGSQLHERLAAAVKDAKLGVEVVFVGLEAVHPPQKSEVAQHFHQQAGALQQQQTDIQAARKDATQSLAEVAGSLEDANRIVAAIGLLRDLQRQAEQAPGEAALQKRVDEQAAAVDLLLASAQGQTARTINEAIAERWDYALAQKTRAAEFAAQLRAFAAAPGFYRVRAYYDAFADAVKDARKVVLATRQAEPALINVDLKDTDSGIGSILGNR